MYSDWGAFYGLVFAFLLLVFLIPVLIVYLVTCYFMSRTFEKMGIRKSLAWIPFRNTWIWFENGGYPGALTLLPLLSFVDFTGGIIGGLANLAWLVIFGLATANLLPRFGKQKELALLALLPPVLFGILASSKTNYQG